MRLGVGSSSSGGAAAAAAVVLWWLTATTNTPLTSEAFSSGSSSTRVGSTAPRTRVASAVDTPSVSALDEDDNALHRKNAIRRKFGLPSLTREEFLELQDQVSQMEREHEAKVQRRRQAASESKKKKGTNLLSTVFGSVLEDTCQDNGDCESPQVCCDFVVKKMCCSSGEKSRNFWEESVTPSQLQPILMPVPVSNGEY